MKWLKKGMAELRPETVRFIIKSICLKIKKSGVISNLSFKSPPKERLTKRKQMFKYSIVKYFPLFDQYAMRYKTLTINGVPDK